MHSTRKCLSFSSRLHEYYLTLSRNCYLYACRFSSGRAMDIIFDGVATDCTSEHTITRGVCGQFRDNSQFSEPEQNHLKFSLIGTVSFWDYFFSPDYKKIKRNWEKSTTIYITEYVRIKKVLKVNYNEQQRIQNIVFSNMHYRIIAKSIWKKKQE